MQARELGTDTAAQQGFNSNTFSICLAGNFLVEKPTEAQKATLKTILKAATSSDVFPQLYKLGIRIKDGTQLNMSMFRIYGHKAFQNYTQCPVLPDDYFRNLLWEDYNKNTRAILNFIQSFWFGNPQTSLGALVSDRHECSGIIN